MANYFHIKVKFDYVSIGCSNGHPNAIPKAIVSLDAKPTDIEVDVGKKITNKQEFIISEHMVQ